MFDTLRLATEDDIPALAVLVKEFYTRTPYATMTFDLGKVYETLLSMTADRAGKFLVLVTENDERRPVGFLIGVAQPLMFCSEDVATELAWWVDPAYRKSKRAMALHKAFEHWAKLKGCHSIVMSSVESDKALRVGALYRRSGYSQAETCFLKEI